MTKKASDLLYGRRKKGPGPKPVDEETYYEDLYTSKLKEAIPRLAKQLDPKQYEVEIESISIGEIIIAAQALDRGKRRLDSVMITAEPSFDNHRPTFPITCLVEGLEYDDDKGRWVIGNDVPINLTIHTLDDIRLVVEFDQPNPELAELLLSEVVGPALEELKVG